MKVGKPTRSVGGEVFAGLRRAVRGRKVSCNALIQMAEGGKNDETSGDGKSHFWGSSSEAATHHMCRGTPETDLPLLTAGESLT